MSYYHTYYKVFDGKKAVIDNSKNHAACFSEYNYRNDLNGYTVELYVKKSYAGLPCQNHTELIFSLDEIKRYLAELRDCSFTFDVREEKDQYVITANESDFANRSHLRTALDFVRLIWEKDINLILKNYLALNPKLVRQHGTFVLIQALNRVLAKQIRMGHYLPSRDYGVLTLDEFMKSVKSKPNHSTGSQKVWFESEAFTSGKSRKEFKELEELLTAIINGEIKTEESKPAAKRVVRKRKVAVAV